MKVILNIFRFILKALNFWIFQISSRVPLLSMMSNFLIIHWFKDGRPIHLLERDLRGISDFVYYAFMVCFALPMFWGFICCWTNAKLTSSKFIKNNTSALDNAIEYRNGQIGVQTPQQAFETMKKTDVLDQIRANKGIDAYDKALTGFNAQYGNQTPQNTFKGLTNDKDSNL
ncbi:MAG: hypothetical protein V4622_12235 [Bacteroidota bacterium]